MQRTGANLALRDQATRKACLEFGYTMAAMPAATPGQGYTSGFKNKPARACDFA
jgi:hypothetical protein